MKSLHTKTTNIVLAICGLMILWIFGMGTMWLYYITVTKHTFSGELFITSMVANAAYMIGILVGSKLDKSGYTDFDTVTLQFYLQQLDSAYQFLKSHRKEKQLIFDLNHRVLQLNSLIDTGIEVARLQELTQLLRLSMERVLALTNASKGME